MSQVPVSQQQSTDSSIATFTSSLVFNVAVTIGIFVAFDIFRKRNKKVYEPRTYLVPESNRSEPLPPGLFAWILPVLKISDEEVIKRIGDEKDLDDDYGTSTFTHPALVAIQPSVWIPNDQNVSNDMVNEFRKDGIKSTNKGASLDRNHKVTTKSL
ncbi:late exocytosis, associated with Golgi transport-domain-containing protein [Rhizophagus diaphanus]|nr:late exocytosis, associated with Golgi transport-domain-containing protein [Rhizophagus diaphanus] [Rhizophagus sp. MUCL 43196]